jgi:hypothetical protein
MPPLPAEESPAPPDPAFAMLPPVPGTPPSSPPEQAGRRRRATNSLVHMLVLVDIFAVVASSR